jgi:nitric oxide reductase activation protein
VCLLVDESGSMGSFKMAKARQTALALREALKDNDALNLWVFGHTADGYDWDGAGETNMSCYWSPTYQADMKAIGAMKARCENRDGMAILASAERVRAESPSMGSNKLMIVISDGEPSAKDYRHGMGVLHVKKVVGHLEGQGWNIIELGISGAREDSMKQMFKNYVIIEDTENLSNTVSKIIRKVIKV